MKKKILYILFLFFVSLGVVNAQNVTLQNPGQEYIFQKLASNTSIYSVTFDGDIAIVKASGFVTGYAVGQTPYVTDSSTRRVTTTSNVFYASVMNGNNTFWVYDDGQSTGSFLPIKYGTVNVTSSCTLGDVKNATGQGTVETCFVYDVKTGVLSAVDKGTLVTCASGYELVGNLGVASNGCTGLSTTYGGQTLDKRYCKVVYSYNCQKVASPSPTPGPSVPAASLASLSVDNGSLSPGFTSGNRSYKVSVGADVGSITVSATAGSGASFVNGYGPRTVNLNYGNNIVYVKVKNSAGAVTTYSISVYRTDGRSSVNTLNSLTLSTGTLSPEFNKDTTTYNVTVDQSVSSIDIGAVLSDSTSYFVEGAGPRTVYLENGMNTIYVRVMSQTGRMNTYTIYIVRGNADSGDICATNASDYALLKELSIATDIEGIKLDDIEFDPTKFTYNINVPYEVGSVLVSAYAKEDGDNIVVSGGDSLEVNIEKTISVVVTSKSCSNISKTYTIGITRQPEYIKGTDASVADIKIAGHEDDFKFDANEEVLYINLKKGEKTLDISVIPTDENASCEIVGNEKLKKGSDITITCTSEDGESTEKYTIEVESVAKGTNVFLIVLLVIIILLVIVYFVLRLLGYKIYFNFAAVGAFFRSIGEKFKNMFDK